MSLVKEQNNWLHIALASIVIIAVLIYQSIYVIIPYLSTEIANKIPPEVVEFIDEITLQNLDESGDLTASEIPVETQQRLKLIFTELVSTHAQSDRQYQLVFRDWKDTANALALPNGTIVVTDKFIEIAENDQSISAVLLHEIAHVEENHGLEGLIKSSIIMVSISFFVGDVGAIGEILASGAIIGADLSYSRKAELEADAFAVRAMLNANENPDALADALNAISQNALASEQISATPTWLSSHPELDDRIEQIRKIKLTSLENTYN